ncbi:thioredoxin fold domain-containing protein [Halorhodospira halochloris]|uniref:thioredoxin fold domain-containing protein n=1 Tax=Halorhodospira halochloris TaxID=1052 RepID=UPI001EE89D5F|nr:thioredoxin fold domain-containing protein [Halorhodospira halochloris]MCG5529463.1 thioredoxin fold domain-containing protein [Halorhodospira halochloris]
MTKRLATIKFFFLALLLAGCPNDAPGESANSSASELEQFRDSHYIAEGDGDMIVYAFTDPQCPACDQLQQRVTEGATPNIEWRWIPVGFLGQGARRDAANRIEEVLDVDGEMAEEENRQLAVSLGVRSVPTIFYRHPNGETYHFSGGNQQQLSGLESVAEQYREEQ